MNRRTGMQHDERVLEGLGKRDTAPGRNHVPRWRDHDQPVGTVRQELHVGAFDWVEQFIQKFTGHLPEARQENALAYNLAKVYFHQAEYEKVIGQLREVEYQSLAYALGSKMMLLRTYYELGEFLALDSLAESFRIYLRRKREISRDVRQQYMNVLRFVRKLSRLDPRDQAAIGRTRKEVEECNALAAKKWVLEKVEELEKN